MTTSTSSLQEVCRYAGVATSYVTAAGDTVDVPAASLRAIVAAMGFKAATDEELEESLQGVVRANQRGGPEPVVVLSESKPASVEVATEGAPGGPVAWKVALEDGRLLTGVLDGPAPGAWSGATRAQQLRLPLPPLPLGYHALQIQAHPGAPWQSSTLIVVPEAAYTPPEWRGEKREWLLTVQLYSLRSASNWGIGDYTDLQTVVRGAAELGASGVGLNPLHVLFPAEAEHASPYSPSSRAWLSSRYLDVTAIPEWSHSTEAQALFSSGAFQTELAAVRESSLVQHARVMALKERVLRLLFHTLRRRGGARAGEFEAFRAHHGLPLHRFALFEALQKDRVRRGEPLEWRQWPEEWQRVDSPQVQSFAKEQALEVEFSEYLQWETDRQVSEVARCALEEGMTIGLYRDVAVGVDPAGAEAWGEPSLLVNDATVGAPPDLYNPLGQNWGLVPLNPLTLRAQAYAPFIRALRANMRHAGAIRLDHVVGLQRLWWVPRGQQADAGGYVQYPLEELLGIVALESQRNRCLVIGEDLGTVPEGFREELERRRMLSYRLLMFEREGGGGTFIAPAQYPATAAIAVSTHDLATLQGLWRGRDLDVRRRLHLFPDERSTQDAYALRQTLRVDLVRALSAESLLSEEEVSALSEGIEGTPTREQAASLTNAAHLFLAAAPSRLLLVQIEDVLGQLDQMNMPGTVDEHPNWRRKLGTPVEEIFNRPEVTNLLASLSRLRHRPIKPW